MRRGKRRHTRRKGWHAQGRVACAGEGRGGLRSRMDCAMGRVGKQRGGLAIWRWSPTFIHPVGECSPGALWLYASIRSGAWTRQIGDVAANARRRLIYSMFFVPRTCGFV